MKFLIILAVVASTASAQAILGAVSTGRSDVSRSDDGLGNYAFGYNEDHAFGGTFRKEKGGPGVKVGSYGLREADGRMRVVNYVADGLGFRASVSTNEPGTDIKQDPAAVSMNFGHIAAAPVALAAPAIAAAPLAMTDARIATPVIAKSFDGRFIKDFDTPLIAKAYGAPIMAKAFGPAIAAVAPITASHYRTTTAHIEAPKMIAAGISPFAKSFVF